MDQATKRVRGQATQVENLENKKHGCFLSKLELRYQITEIMFQLSDNRDHVSKLKLGVFGTKMKPALCILQVCAGGVDNRSIGGQACESFPQCNT